MFFNRVFFNGTPRAAAALLSVSALFGAAHFDDKVRADFFAGFAGDSAALERAMAEAQEAIDGDPRAAAEAKAWHGGGLLFQSGHYFQIGEMKTAIQLRDRAMEEMDSAGAAEPDNPAVLIPRAAAWFAASRNMPPEMGKPVLEKALADYSHVYDLQRGFFDRLDIHMRSELLFGLADGYARDGQPDKARTWFQEIEALGPRGGHYEQARQYLRGEKYSVTGIGCVGCHTGGSRRQVN
jgi:tetratricopeptide (TPR) repeat protein